MTGRRIRRRFVATASSLGLLFAGFFTPAYASGETGPTELPEPPATLECEALTGFEFEDTTITSTGIVPNGGLSHRGEPIDEHCLVTGQMNERISEVDGQEYAIEFEMRLPEDWSGQYLYQGNGGLDGAVDPALGTAGGSESALQMGMAVISSDAGHTSEQNPTFGIDPQARLDYGYQAVETLTPMAKDLIEARYGSQPEYSYMAGSSNGGRHTMVGASRYTDAYDGYLAVAPGFNLPQAATAQLWGAQQWETVATSEDLNTALTTDERVLVANAILEQCDALDGVADGMVFDSATCQEVFDVTTHIDTCDAERDGSCLTEEQQAVVARVFSGATTSDGAPIYESFPYDPGMTSEDWGSWKFEAPINRDSVAVGYIFTSPPDAPELSSLRDYVLGLDIDEANRSIYATSGEYSESAMEFMTPPDLDYQDLYASGGKMIVMHGASDGVFSMADTAAWYQGLEEAHGGDASDFVQYYEIPGMTHTRGGPATDQHHSLTALVEWVENGTQPNSLTAWVNPANDSLPADWSAERSRPLCAYPEVATYVDGDIESAANFECHVSAGVVELNPEISVDVDEVEAGETVTVSGSGYTADSTVTIDITDADGQIVENLEGVSTDPDGAFAIDWETSEDIAPGNFAITATDDTEPTASATVNVVVVEAENAATPTPSPTPTETAPAPPAPTETSSATPSPSQSEIQNESSAPPGDISKDVSPAQDAAAKSGEQDSSLALTGASGIALLIGAALVLLLIGAGVLRYSHKRRAQHR